ncbi:Histone h2a deubiquitinase [Thalictrum thalictroides]|uniref:Histone h2a deubiquitinase n=1 Tax=Thalictrum thalictroides TaxID=46969 RepID=A0A7J6XDP1_THATH|nr:Histone h2a deubiquitinase [Thalictrum thalictroides]
MAASANPSGNQEGNNNNNQHLTGGTASSGGNPNNNNNTVNGKPSTTTTATDISSSSVVGPVQSMKHNPGLSVKWTPEEQSILDDGLIKYASETPMVRYARIALLLNDKTVRDVALRCRWMTESGKRRKEDVSRKNKDKKEKIIDPSAKSSGHLAVRPNVLPYAPPVIPLDNDDGITYKAIGGPTGHLLEQNAQIFDQISANFTTLQIHENINLFCQTRDNILTIMNDLNDMPGIMKQMPALPVKVNEELANSILPRTTRQMQS